MQVSTDLPPWGFKFDLSLAEILSQKGSPVGFSAISSFLSCPERSRLRSIGMRRKSSFVIEGVPDDLGATELGSLMHYLLAGRIVYGQDAVEAILGHQESSAHAPLPLPEAERLKLLVWMRSYDAEYPIEEEPFEYLAVEAEVFTDIGDGTGGPCIRSARYDAVVRFKEGTQCAGQIFSHEHKTASRGGIGAINQYRPQYATQCAVWNRNPHLVEKYGRMVGVIPDLIIKTDPPKFERAYRFVEEIEIERIALYLREPERTRFKRYPDGSYPRRFDQCFKGWPPCEYVALCYEDEQNSYEVIDGR